MALKTERTHPTLIRCTVMLWGLPFGAAHFLPAVDAMGTMASAFSQSPSWPYAFIAAR